MIDFVGWWGSVLPAFLLMLLVWRVAERFEPGYGAAAAIALGLGTMVLPFSTLLFSHVFSAMLGFAAFALLLRERDGPPRPLLLAAAGLAVGYAITSEYPLAFVAIVLGLYALSRPDSLRAGAIAGRAGAYVTRRRSSASCRCCSTTTRRFTPGRTSPTRTSRSSTKASSASRRRARACFVTLLLDSRGLLTLSPVLVMGALGTVLLYRRGRRAEALTIAGVCACYLIYNSGYYLPFGGGAPGPRFMITMLPFLACPLGLALRRWPGPTIALAGASIAAWTIVTITHPLVGYENETVVWTRLLSKAEFQPTIATRARRRAAAGAGSGRSCSRSPARVLAGGRRHAAPAPDGRRARRGRARAARLGAVRGARADRARDRPPGPAQHRQSRRPHGAGPSAAQRQPLPADAAHALLRGRRRARARGDVAGSARARRRHARRTCARARMPSAVGAA